MRNFFTILSAMLCLGLIGMNGQAYSQTLTPCTASSTAQNVAVRQVLSFSLAQGETYYDNQTGASSYSDYTDPCVPYDVNEYGIQLGVRTSGPGTYLAIWIDYNDNGVFETSETIFNYGPLTTGGINTPLGNQTGRHLMRIIASADPITSPCGTIADGEVEDYTICFSCTPQSANQDIWIANVRHYDFTAGWIYANPSGASSYSDYTGSPIQMLSYNSQINITPSVGGQYIAVYIDLNGDGSFDSGEQWYNGQDGGNPGIALGLGLFERVEKPKCVKIRIILSSKPITGPCDNIESGEIEDYLLCFPTPNDGGGMGGFGKTADWSTAAEIAVYPSPASQSVTLHIGPFSNEGWNISIVDIQGKSMIGTLNIQQETTLDISQWAKGIYFVTAQQGENLLTRKLIVE